MKLILKENRVLLMVYLLLAFIGLALLLIYPKNLSFLTVTPYHTDFLNSFFKVMSKIGNGFFALAFIPLFTFKKIRTALYLAIAYAFSGILVQFLKRVVFDDVYRPIKHFAEQGIEIYKVPGFENYLIYSFPSGHTTSAFVLFFGLALISRNLIVKFLLFALAITIGYSRIYLSQHFPEDVLAGSFLGIACALFFLWLSNRWTKPWLDLSIIQLFKKK